METPPEGCSAIVRLELVALGETIDPQDKTLANTCPDGFAPSGGHCVKKGSGAGYRCQPDDPNECKQQCDKGNAESCLNAAKFADTQVDKALLMRKACDGDVASACTQLAYLLAVSIDARVRDTKRAGELALKGCNLLSPGACSFMANFAEGKAREEKRTWGKKSCELGVFDDCVLVARLDINDDCNSSGCTKTEKHTQEGLDLLDTWCTAGKFKACQELATLYGTGHMMGRTNTKGDTTEVSPDTTKAADYQAKFCKLSPSTCGSTPTASGSSGSAGSSGASMGFAGSYTATGSAKPITFTQVGTDVTFTSSVGDVKCTVTSVSKLSCNFKDAKTGKSGQGMLFRGPDGKLTGQYIVQFDGKKNLTTFKNVDWAFTPKKK
jgi:hypothetical protein